MDGLDHKTHEKLQRMDSNLRKITRKLSQVDAFPKISSELKQGTKTGGLVSLLLYGLLAFLAVTEIIQWRAVRHDYKFVVDSNRGRKIDINLDVTVAMNCQDMRIDVIDVTGTATPVPLELVQRIPSHFSSDDLDELAVHLLKSGLAAKDSQLDVHSLMKGKFRDINSKRQRGIVDACRFKGSVTVNKVNGMLHFTSIGHGYFSFSQTPVERLNFTHRIDKLTFGKHYPGLHSPLDSTFSVAEAHLENIQYFIGLGSYIFIEMSLTYEQYGLVPTIYIDKLTYILTDKVYTTQYAVTEHKHVIDINKPDTFPGIFLKYEIEPISVEIIAHRKGFVQFVTRICGVIGGVFVVVGMIFRLIFKIRQFLMRNNFR